MGQDEKVKENEVAEGAGGSRVEEEKAVASHWKLMWWRLRRHRLALAGGVVVILVYFVSAFAEFIAPYDPNEINSRYVFAPPQLPRLVGEQGFQLRPFVLGYEKRVDPDTFRRLYTPDSTKVYPLYFFVKGPSYKFWGLWETDLHLFGTEEGPVFLLGTDRIGRDMFSRIVYGARISSTIGLVGVFLSFALGIVIGGFSGFYGGRFDTVTQRIIEFIMGVPTLPLWMGLSAAVPPEWPPARVYFGLIVILSLLGWPGLARVVRSKFLSLREEEFVLAARLMGVKESRIIIRHMLPSFMSYVIASITLAIPGMILGETGLSYLGLGIRYPAVSWGMLLQEAQNVSALAFSPWLLIPGLMIIVTVVAFNFLGDGLRDASDPYQK